MARIPLTFPGGSYAELWPNGRRAVLHVGRHVETDRGEVALPADGQTQPLQVRVSAQGRLYGHGTDGPLGGRALLHDGERWQDVGAAYGINSGAFTPEGLLVLATPIHGSQGIRFIDEAGRRWTGDETYLHPTLRLAEWTQRGDVTVGQGMDEGGVILCAGPHRKQIAPGFCIFVRFNRIGDQLAIAWWEAKAGRAAGLLLDVADIPHLPDAVAAPPDPPLPQPPPPIPPSEPVMPWTPLMPDRTDVVQRLKNDFPDEWAAMNVGSDLRFIKRLAATLHALDPNFGLNGKRGTNTLSEDCVAYKNPTVDNGPEVADVVLAHGSPEARPGWLNVTKDSQGWKADGTKDAEGGAGAKWIRPDPITPMPAPTPPPAPPSAPDPALAQEIAALRDQLTALRVESAALKVRLDAAEDLLKGCAKKGDPVEVSGKVLGLRLRLTGVLR